MKFKSQVVTEASGSIGGMTFSHNRGGLYVRARAVPVNPNTPEQQAVRGFMSALTGIWLNVLTPTQRDGWDAYAASVTIPDRLGEPRNVGGLGMFVRSNSFRNLLGLTPVANAPSIFNLGDYTSPNLNSVVVATNLATFTIGTPFGPQDEWISEDGAALGVFLSRPKNASINFFKGPYRFAGSVLGDSITPPTSPATVTPPFAFVAGQRIFARFNVTRADGRLGAAVRDFVLTTA